MGSLRLGTLGRAEAQLGVSGRDPELEPSEGRRRGQGGD